MGEFARISIDELELSEVISHFNSRIFSDGIIKDIDVKVLRDWLANPEKHKKEIQNLAMYYYISNGDVFQQFDLTRVLPTLEYQINTMKRDSRYKENTLLLRKTLKNINHKELTRDIMSQTIAAGTIVGIWAGEGRDIYPVIFDDLEYFFPAYRKNGKWVVWCDLSYFDKLPDLEKRMQFENLSPYVTEEQYKKYKSNTMKEEYRYIEFPIDRAFAVRTHTLMRNQRFGTSWVTPVLYDVLHKKKLKDLEKSVANKIVNAIGVLTIGNEENPNLKLNKNIKQKVYSRSRQALEKNEVDGVTLISLPEWSKLEFPQVKSDALEPDKFESINSDIASASGVAKGLTNGEGTYAGSKINLEIIFRKISELLEEIESEVYDKLFNLLLPKNVADNYYIEYSKEYPLSAGEKLSTLMQLNSLGFSTKYPVELMGIDYAEYVENTLYEIEKLKLREKVIPPMSTYTTSDSTETKETETNPENENTAKSQDYGSNETPRADI